MTLAADTRLVPDHAETNRPRAARTNAQQLGDAAEDLVAGSLAEAGWSIVARNVRVRRAEIDLIAIDPGPPVTIVFVEVRWRGRRDFGLADETIDVRKRGRLHRAAWEWLAERTNERAAALPVRFDLIVVEPGRGTGERRMRHHRASI
ncbi:MAG TPA: YraN family protein [Candidatus Limnocylindrales bacterium]|nr:YraN family protein [Candidatus Limnocylindrales bacterium]